MNARQRFNRIILFSAVAAFCSGCGSQSSNIKAVEDQIRSQLKDPETARFSNVREISDSQVVCGEVNAKNSFGAYSGRSKFWGAVDADGQVLAYIIPIEKETLCDMSDAAEKSVDAAMSTAEPSDLGH